MADFKSIKRAYHLLVLEALVITSLGLLYSAESLWVVIDPNGVSLVCSRSALVLIFLQAMRSGENIAVIYTLAFLTSTLAELLVCLILLYKTVRPLYRKSTGQTQTLTEGIMIEVGLPMSCLDATDSLLRPRWSYISTPTRTGIRSSSL